MKTVFILLSLLLFLPQVMRADEKEPTTKIGPTCTFGNSAELTSFFSRQQLVQIAKGVRRNPDSKRQDQTEVIFLVSEDMKFFHVATLKPENDQQLRACIISSAREVDLQVDPPIENFLLRKPREHLLFLDDVPKTGECPPDKNNCTPWTGKKELIGKNYLLTAYLYSEHWQVDAYTQIVDIRLDKKLIQPSRGILSEFARLKYAARLRNEFNEDAELIEKAKHAYQNIYDEVDHEHPLYLFIINENNTWEIKMLDRHRGIVWVPLRGDNLELYPLDPDEYKQLRDN